MAGDDDRERIAAIRRAHCPHRIGFADGASDIAVAAGLAVGDVAQRLPYRLLKGGATGGKGQGEALQATGKIGVKFGEEGSQRFVILLPATHIGQCPQARHKVHVHQTGFIDGDQQIAAAGRQNIVADHGVISCCWVSGCCSLPVARSSKSGASLMACHSQLAA